MCHHWTLIKILHKLQNRWWRSSNSRVNCMLYRRDRKLLMRNRRPAQARAIWTGWGKCSCVCILSLRRNLLIRNSTCTLFWRMLEIFEKLKSKTPSVLSLFELRYGICLLRPLPKSMPLRLPLGIHVVPTISGLGMPQRLTVHASIRRRRWTCSRDFWVRGLQAPNARSSMRMPPPRR